MQFGPFVAGRHWGACGLASWRRLLGEGVGGTGGRLWMVVGCVHTKGAGGWHHGPYRDEHTHQERPFTHHKPPQRHLLPHQGRHTLLTRFYAKRHLGWFRMKARLMLNSGCEARTARAALSNSPLPACFHAFFSPLLGPNAAAVASNVLFKAMGAKTNTWYMRNGGALRRLLAVGRNGSRPIRGQEFNRVPR